MIHEIRLENIFSVKEEVVLDLRAANLRSARSKALVNNSFECGRERLLKSVSIYGANASGKSNIIKAIRFFCRLILDSHNFNEGVKFNYQPFRFDGWSEKPSIFGIVFSSKGRTYDYSISILNSEIVTEELYLFEENRKIRKPIKVFTRNELAGVDKSDKYSFGTYIERPLEVARNTSIHSLYLSRASQMDREIGKELFNYFNGRFILGYLNQSVQSIVHTLSNYKDIILEGLQIADSDIVNYEFKVEKQISPGYSITIGDSGAETISKDIENEYLFIKTFHKQDPSLPFDFESEESEGTKKLFKILLRLIDILQGNKILLIDQLDDELHTKMVKYVVDLFHTSTSAQLIFTSHNTNLMRFDLFRRDQIYFVNKGKDASTDLYSLYEFKEFRENMDPEKGYLLGRFHAVPYVDEVDDYVDKLEADG